MRAVCRTSLLGAVASAGCAQPTEVPRVAIDLVVDSSGLLPVTNDLGYLVEVAEAELVVVDFEFARAGEMHTRALWPALWDAIIPAAYAHPGHSQEGDVTGELLGQFHLQWRPGQVQRLAPATLLVGDYASANFTFGFSGPEDSVTAGREGTTGMVRGIATRGGRSIVFEAVMTAPPDRLLVGIPFEVSVTLEVPSELAFRLVTEDPLEGDTLFDGIDFGALDVDGDGVLTLVPEASEPAVVEAAYALRRTLMTHDHYEILGTSDF